MAASHPSSVLALKKAFLAKQVLLLSQQQSLIVSDEWSRAHPAADGSRPGLDPALVHDVVLRVEHAIRRHCRRVYPPHASAHVAEQVDRLYWDAAAPSTDSAAGASGVPLVSSDLADPVVIAALPPHWPSDVEARRQPLEARRYADTAAQLTSLAERRAHIAPRVVRLRRLAAALAPFRTGLQANLVTRDGAVGRELERMSVLLARVGGRVALLRRRHRADSGGVDVHDADQDPVIPANSDGLDRAKIDALLHAL